jgi:tetratricopeptide (TPR) repeat protein
LTWAEQAADLAPDRAPTWLLIAELYDRLNRPGVMLEPLRKAVRLDPDLYPAHANLAYALQFAGQPEEALREAKWCLDRKPDDVAVRRWLAKSLRDQGEHEAALQEIRKALALAPDDVDSRIVEADLLMFGRDADGAYSALKRFYPAEAHRRDFLGSLSRAAALSGRKDESRRYQQELTRLIEKESQSNKLNPNDAIQ